MDKKLKVKQEYYDDVVCIFIYLGGDGLRRWANLRKLLWRSYDKSYDGVKHNVLMSTTRDPVLTKKEPERWRS